MSDNRDSSGRFIKGVSGNPGGRPIDQSKYLKKIDTAITFKEWRCIILKAIEQAKRGDAKARQWLSDYLLGKAPQALNITGDMRYTLERFEDTPEEIDSEAGID